MAGIGSNYSVLIAARLDQNLLQAQLDAIGKDGVTISVTADLSKFTAQMDAAQAKIQDQIDSQLLSVNKFINQNGTDGNQSVQEAVLAAQQYQAALIEVQDQPIVTSAQLANIGELKAGFLEAKSAIVETSGGLAEFGQKLITSIQYTITYGIAVQTIFGMVQNIKNGIQYVIDLNTALTNTQMITGQTVAQTQTLYTGYQQLAQQLGSTTLEVASANDMWLRQGKSAQDALTLTQQSIMVSKLAMTDSATAAQSLTAILNGFGMSADQASSAMDKMLSLANSSKTSAAVSFETLSQAMQVSAATANEAGISYEQLNSYIATIATTTQENGDKIGNAMKSMAARMESIKAGATEDGLTINNVDEVLKRYAGTLGDVDLVSGNLGDAIQQLGQHWNELDPFAQKQIATAVAGKNTNARTYSNIWINYNLDNNYVLCYN
jgi:TP901 family phage tail tape measure protein